MDISTPAPGKAALWMIGSILSFSAMAVAGRAAQTELDTFEVMFYRSILGLPIVAAAAWWAGTLSQVTGRSYHIHGLRNLAHFAGQNLWLYALTAIPLVQVFALEFTAPIWVVVLAPLVLGERMTAMRAACAALGFAGILVIARPLGTTISPGLIAAAGAAIAFALTALFTRMLTRSTSITCILFHMTVLQAIFGLIITAHDGHITVPGLAVLPTILVVSLSGLIAHFCITTALTLAPASVVMPVDFARLPLIALIGVWLYAEPLEIQVFVGAGIILGANYLGILHESRRIRVAGTRKS